MYRACSTSFWISIERFMAAQKLKNSKAERSQDVQLCPRRVRNSSLFQNHGSYVHPFRGCMNLFGSYNLRSKMRIIASHIQHSLLWGNTSSSTLKRHFCINWENILSVTNLLTSTTNSPRCAALSYKTAFLNSSSVGLPFNISPIPFLGLVTLYTPA